MLRRDLVFAGLAFLLSPARVPPTTGEKWHWMKAENDGDGWSVSEGDADVSIEGGRFSAKLFRKGSDEDLQILLQGTIENGSIVAKETIEASDQSGSTYRGTFRRKKWQEVDGTTGAESINLSDGWSMIGILRSIPK